MSNVIYINFEANTEATNIFKRDLDPSRIMRELSVLSGQTIRVNETLLFFDEIQVCEQALTSLKYFYDLNSEILRTTYCHIAKNVKSHPLNLLGGLFQEI